MRSHNESRNLATHQITRATTQDIHKNKIIIQIQDIPKNKIIQLQDIHKNKIIIQLQDIHENKIIIQL